MKEYYDWQKCKITKYYPMYNPARSEITYLEFKIVDENSKDRGYILVSLKEDEPRVTESSHGNNGTCYELLADKAGTDNIRAVRFSFASYVAEDRDSSRGNPRILATLGNIGDSLDLRNSNSRAISSTYQGIINTYNKNVQENGGYLDTKKEFYKENNINIINTINNDYSPNTRGAITHNRIETSQITWYDTGVYPLMKANQYVTNGVSAGCVPVSGAIIAAYWEAVKGYNIYPGNPTPKSGTGYNSPYSNFQQCVESFRKHLGMLDCSSSSLNSSLGNAFWYYAKEKGISLINGWRPIYYECWGADGIASDSPNLGNLDGYRFQQLAKLLNASFPASLGYWELDGKGHSAPIYEIVIKINSCGIYYNVIYSIDTGWWYIFDYLGTTNGDTGSGGFTKDIPVSIYNCTNFELLYR